MNNGSFFTGLSLFFLGQRGEGIFAVVEMVSSGSVCLTMILEGNCEIFCERRGRGRGGANYLKKKKVHVTSAFINCVKRKAKKIRGFLIIVSNSSYTLSL